MSKLLDLLHELVPGTRIITDSYHLTADALLSALASAGVKLNLTSILGFDEANFDDDELALIVFGKHLRLHEGRIIIHSPACSRFDLPDFECSADHLLSFIHDYDREMLFDGDVVFLAPTTRTLTVFHHEGAFGHCTLPSPNSTTST